MHPIANNIATNNIATNNIAAAIIAGGQNSRMQGADKCLLAFAGNSILDQLLQRLQPYLNCIILNANGDTKRFQQYALPVVSDDTTITTAKDQEGPLAGIIASLTWLKDSQPKIDWMLSTPSDTPFIPTNYVQLFAEQTHSQHFDICIARYRNTDHYLHGIWSVEVLNTLTSLFIGGERSIKWVLKHFKVKYLDFSSITPDPFFNINSPKDYEKATTRSNQ